MRTLSVAIFLEICDDRYQSRSMILTSQVPTDHWHEQIGDPTLADSILAAGAITHIASNSTANRCARAAEGKTGSAITPHRRFYSAERGQGTQRRSPCPTPPSPLKPLKNTSGH